MRSHFSAPVATAVVVWAVLFAFLFPAFGQNYKNPPFIPTSSDPVGIATADLNQDGKPDLIYVDGEDTLGNHALHILLGNGNGSFSHKQDISLPAGICCIITVADVTGDGIPDIIMQGSTLLSNNGMVAVMVGNGDGSFQAPLVTSFTPTAVSGPPSFGFPAVGDINGDGKMDLVLTDNSNGYIYLLLGNNSGTFNFSGEMLAYAGTGVYLTDLNGDGKLDLIALDDIGAGFLVYLGNGNGTFQNYTRYTVSTSAGFILADIDGDGHPDMVTQFYPGMLGYFKGNPDGTFAQLATIGAAPLSDQLVRVADFNADNNLDLAFFTPAGAGVELNTGNLTFSAVKESVSSTIQYPNYADYPAVADFNGDGFTDLAMPVEGGIAILLGKGDGTFASADLYSVGQQAGAVAIADFSGNGNADIAVTVPATYPRLLLGNGQGSFTLGTDQNTSYGTQAPDSNIFAADFNGDGIPDIDFGDIQPYVASSGTQSIAYGVGNGTFTTPAQIPNASPIIADFNQDGRQDMISVSGLTATVLLGQANETFQTVTTTLRNPSSLFGVGDVNNDGKPDLILNYVDHIEVWFGNGDGTFSYATNVDNGGYGYDFIPVVTDLDGDGNADIVLAPQYSEASLLVVLYGNGDGTFQAPTLYPLSRQYIQILVADVNRDNKPDLIMTDGRIVAVMINEGSRNFDAETFYVAGRSVSLLSVADVNGDGYPDIVAANPGDTTVSVLLNQPNGTSVEGAATIGTLSVNPDPVISGQTFTVSLTVASAAAGGATPTGTADLNIDGTYIETASLSSGAVSFSVTTALTPGLHTFVVTYNGDANYAPKSFATLENVQAPTYSTQTSLTAAPASLLASQTVHLVATVSSTPAVPTGLITFYDGTKTIGSAVLNSSLTAIFDTSLLSVGTHNLTAAFDGYTQYSFNGNSSYVSAIFAVSTSPGVTVVVNDYATTTSLSADNTAPTSGTVVTFTATVSSASGTPFGGASFFDGSNLLGTSALANDGTATFSTAALSAGAHSITAQFNANGPFGQSTSTALDISVQAASASAIGTVVALVPQIDPATGASSLGANVSALSGSPTGLVTFLDSGKILGTAETGENGSAQLSVGVLSPGTHVLSASFGGGAAFAPSASLAITEQWPANGPEFSVVPAASSLRVTAGGSNALSIAIVPRAGFSLSISLACTAGLPQGYGCRFSPSTLDGGGNSILTVAPLSDAARVRPSELLRYSVLLCALPFALVAMLRRRWRPVLLLLVVGGSLCSFSGCAGGGSSSSRQETVLTIQASAGGAGSRVVHSSQVTLIVAAAR